MTIQKSGYPSGLMATDWAVLMIYFCIPGEDADRWLSEELRKAIPRLIDAELLEYVLAKDIFEITDRGRCIADFIACLNLPNLTWEMRF